MYELMSCLNDFTGICHLIEFLDVYHNDLLGRNQNCLRK